MAKKKFELHEERLATTDERGHRVFLYPEDIKGVWHNRRLVFMWFLIFVYMILPWIHWNGRQIILLDIPGREFTIFGTTFLAHDAPLLFLLLVGFLFALGFITSIWGRVWCGWACPQSVFIEMIYRPIERLVEGRARQRAALDQSPWSLEKATKKGLKWFLLLLVSLHISHSFLGYFVGARKLFWISLSPPTEHMTLFLFMLSLTALFLFDFGWFREQFCIIACPYGRLQSVMMDENSVVVAYDSKRGEPRRAPEVSHEDEGDCINCYHCVKVCPTGIDIRRGTQLECIACTNCIDACDEIMEKVARPKGLIRYDTENGLAGKEVKKFRPRSFIYLAAMLVIFSAFVYAITSSQYLEATLIRGTGTPFRETTLDDGSTMITNLYRIRLDYKGDKKYLLHFVIAEPEYRDKIEVITPRVPLPFKKGQAKPIVHFKFSKSILTHGNRKITLQIRDGKTAKNSKLVLQKELNLVGPFESIQAAQAVMIPWVALGAGLTGSIHCIGMCGALAASCTKGWSSNGLYQIGRLLGYSILGAFAGSVGHFLTLDQNNAWLKILPAALIGPMLMAWGVQSWRGKRMHIPLPGFINKFNRKLWAGAFSAHSPGLKSFLVGLLSIFLPCGLLYGVVLAVATFQNPLIGAVAMATFWLGTVPAMMLAPELFQRLLGKIMARIPKLASVILIGLGIFTISMRMYNVFATTAPTCH